MAVKLFGQLRDITFSSWKRPTNKEEALKNVLRFSISGAKNAGCIAGVLALFSKNATKSNSIESYMFQGSLATCATCSVFAVFLFCKFSRLPTTPQRAPLIERLYKHTASLERGVVLTCSIMALAGLVARDFMNTDPIITSLAERSIGPLMWVGGSGLAIMFFHVIQHEQVEKK